jgi:hypothetical protein
MVSQEEMYNQISWKKQAGKNMISVPQSLIDLIGMGDKIAFQHFNSQSYKEKTSSLFMVS